jgi:hypothetical protein
MYNRYVEVPDRITQFALEAAIVLQIGVDLVFCRFCLCAHNYDHATNILMHEMLG